MSFKIKMSQDCLKHNKKFYASNAVEDIHILDQTCWQSNKKVQKRSTYQCLNPLANDYNGGFVFRRRTQLLWQFDNGPGQSLKLSNVSAPFSNYPTHLRTGNKHFDSQRHITIMRICEAFNFELFINEVLRLKYKKTNVNKAFNII